LQRVSDGFVESRDSAAMQSMRSLHSTLQSAPVGGLSDGLSGESFGFKHKWLSHSNASVLATACEGPASVPTSQGWPISLPQLASTNTATIQPAVADLPTARPLHIVGAMTDHHAITNHDLPGQSDEVQPLISPPSSPSAAAATAA
jgi:hypothetical protein